MGRLGEHGRARGAADEACPAGGAGPLAARGVRIGVKPVAGGGRDQGAVIVAAARRWIGTPYRHQAAVKGAGCDCLGLIRGVWRELRGEEPEAVPAYSMDWSEPQGEERLWAAARRHLRPCRSGEAARAGDVLLFRMRAGAVAKHLGILARVGRGTNDGAGASFIHSYSGHGVVESPLSAPWQRRIVARFRFPEENG